MNAGSSTPLAELMGTRLGSVDPSKHPDEVFDLYSVPAFDNGVPEVLEGRAIGSAKQVVEPGDVLLSRIVPHIRRAWVVGESRGRRIIASGEWIVFRSDRVDSGYLRHVLVGDPFHTEFMRTVSGVGGSLLRARPAYVSRIQVPLPPRPEQKRIAEVLDRAEALLAKRRAALAQLDTLTQAIFLDMFGDPATNPKCWPKTLLDDVVAEMQYGPRFYNESYADDGIRIVRITDLTDSGQLDFESMPRMRVSDEDEAKFRLRPGEVIFARSGATVGKVALFAAADPPCIPGAYFIRLRFHDTVSPEYALAVLTTRSIRAIIESRSRQAAQQNFSGPALRRLPMPTPPLALQRQFVERKTAVDRRRAIQQSALVELDTLFASLQHRAFRGEL